MKGAFPYMSGTRPQQITSNALIEAHNFGLDLCTSFIQPCFFCRPSDSTVSENPEIEIRTIPLALTTLLNLTPYSTKPHI
jgi:hypothetical protein